MWDCRPCFSGALGGKLATVVAAGQLFGGDYRVVEPLSVGGMGAVYVAEQLSTGKRRALKVMHGHIEAHEKLRQRFATEARVGSLVRSEHVVDVVAAGVDDATGSPWLAMELLDGSDLERFLEQRGPMSLDAGRNVLRQVGHALAAAHEAKIVHRDLKPANVFLAKSQRADVPYTVKLLDFGIVKLLSDLTHTGTEAIGTPLYMAPEQVTGKGVGPATDVWAFGLLAFAIWVGRVYWVAERDPVELFREIDRGAVEAASERARRLGFRAAFPTGFDEWFARCVAVDPGRRFADGREASRALGALDFSGDAPAPVAAPSKERVPDTLPGTILATQPGHPPTPVAPTLPAPPAPTSPPWEPVPARVSTSPFPQESAKRPVGLPNSTGRSVLIALTAASACLLLFALIYVLFDPFEPAATPDPSTTTTPLPAPATTKIASGALDNPFQEFGYLSVNCRPGCRVLVEGREVGTSPVLRHRLRVGLHTLVVRQGKVKKTSTVKIEKGATTTRVFNLARSETPSGNPY